MKIETARHSRTSSTAELWKNGLLKSGDQVYQSADGGETWEPLGPRLPQKGSGVAYSSGLRSVLVWRSSEKRVPDAIDRWDLPKDADR